MQRIDMEKVHLNDDLLIHRIQDGDLVAMESLFGKYHRKAYSYALKLTRHTEEAGDVVSEAFLRVYRSINRFQHEGSFSTWLYRILKNCFLDMKKKRTVKIVASLDAASESEDGDLFLQPIDESADPFEDAVTKARTESVHRAIAMLPLAQQQMIIMCHGQLKTYEQISAELGLPVGTVKSRLNRARRSLLVAMKADGDPLVLDYAS